jgi:hypothetical protein
MTDVLTTAAVCIGTGTFGAMFCATFGFDPTLLAGGLLGGFMGCLIVQTLIPDKADVRMRRILALMLGSVLLATITTAVISPTIIRLASLQDVPAGLVRLAVGAVIGGLAQPLVVIGSAKILKWVGGIGTKESPNA